MIKLEEFSYKGNVVFTIGVDAHDMSISLIDQSGNSIMLDHLGKSITIKDVTGNELLMSDSGIKLHSQKDIVLSAYGKIDISAKSGIGLMANSDLKAEGANIQMSAKAGFTAKGNATAEISAAGQTTVKGAMVMIN